MITDSPPGPTGPHGHPGPPGPHGKDVSSIPTVGVPSPHSVTQIQVIQLRWEYLAGNELWEHVEIWSNSSMLASRDRSIGVTGASGPA